MASVVTAPPAPPTIVTASSARRSASAQPTARAARRGIAPAATTSPHAASAALSGPYAPPRANGNSTAAPVNASAPALAIRVEWLQQLPVPVRVAYEAGPTGYGLARACAAAGIASRWRHHRRSSVRRRTGSRPTVATRSGWRGCCGSVSWLRCASRSRTRKRRVTSCERVRTRGLS
jgi:uncharacterized protein (DUF1800 family)